MKRTLIILLVFSLIIGTAFATEEQIEQYEAIANHDVNLRRKPVNGALISVIAEGDKVTVLEYSEDWCRVKYRSRTGYCMTKYLDRFRSLDAHAYPLPGHTPCVGFIRFEEETFLSGDAFEGITVKPQQVACVLRVSEEGYHLPVWRGETVIPLEKGLLSSFIPWQKAKSGDVIGGFTTYYGEQQGKGYATERAANIQIGCDRIHGQTVEEGQSFSFNALCFPYTQENGYFYAPNISKEGFNYGGGVCQVTTTLYNALLSLPLQIDAWAVHRYSGVSYVPQFFDAAVGRYSDLSFTNTLPYPIMILAWPQEGLLTVLIVKK